MILQIQVPMVETPLSLRLPYLELHKDLFCLALDLVLRAREIPTKFKAHIAQIINPHDRLKYPQLQMQVQILKHRQRQTPNQLQMQEW